MIHDARFYAVQALGALLPGRFADDLYFRFGSQDQFSTFTLIYEPVLAAFGMARAALALTVIGQAFWLGGLVYLARGLFRDGRTTLVAVATSAILPGGILLNYAEPFVTPRLFAEAMTLWALGLMLRGRPAWALLLLGLSATVHPLMTLPGLAVLLLHEAAGQRLWWAIGAVAVIAVLALAYSGIEPFSRLSDTYDPAWLAVVRLRDFFCLLAEWPLFFWLKVANILLLAVLGISVAEPRERKFLIVTLVVAVGSAAATFIGGDVLHNVLIVNIQQYRATWLLALTANLFVGAVLLRMPWGALSRATRLVLLCAFGLVAAMAFLPTHFEAFLALAFAGFASIWERQRGKPCSPITYVACAAILFAVLVPGRHAIWNGIVDAVEFPALYRNSPLGLPIVTAVVIGAAIHVSLPGRVRRNLIVPFIVLAAGLNVIGLLYWDQRTPWTRFIETTDEPPAQLTALLPKDRQIYWEGDVRFPWFVLRRPNYFSCAQGTGALFFRGTAITYQQRYDAFSPLRTLDFGQETSCPSPPGPDSPSFSHDALVSVCVHEPELGALVLTRPVPDTTGGSWTSPVAFTDIRPDGQAVRSFTTNRFFIYSCDALR